jgi:predicted nucleic acid-binding protein
MSQYTALLDANVLYPAPLRDILLQLTVADLFRAKWSATIHQEWIEALLRNEPHRERATLEKLRDLMDSKTRDSLVTGYEELIPSLKLPDPDDRHVLAAAIVGRCDVIVTKNLKHFPDEALKKYKIEKLHPDDFLLNQLNLAPVRFCAELRKVRSRLKNPPYRRAG